MIRIPDQGRFELRLSIRGGKFDVLEGEWPVDRTTVVEFESYEKAKQCYQSPEYSKARDVRKKSAKSDFILIEGF